MKDLPGEVFIKGFLGDTLLLSDMRLQYWVSDSYKSVRLEDITYIEYIKRPIPFIMRVTLFLSVLATPAAYWIGGAEAISSGLFAAFLIFALGYALYLNIQHADIRFYTAGGNISITADRLDSYDVFQFIEMVEHAMHTAKNKKIY